MVGAVRGKGLLGLGLLLLAGCGGEERVVPVRGRATVRSQALTVGRIAFFPDAARGNTSKSEPRGKIEPDGEYVLMTGEREGAPPGWYKVLVFSSEQMRDSLRGGAPTDPKWLIHRKFTDAKTTPLSVEVVADPKEGAYDLVVTR